MGRRSIKDPLLSRRWRVSQVLFVQTTRPSDRSMFVRLPHPPHRVRRSVYKGSPCTPTRTDVSSPSSLRWHDLLHVPYYPARMTRTRDVDTTDDPDTVMRWQSPRFRNISSDIWTQTETFWTLELTTETFWRPTKRDCQISGIPHPPKRVKFRKFPGTPSTLRRSPRVSGKGVPPFEQDRGVVRFYPTTGKREKR